MEGAPRGGLGSLCASRCPQQGLLYGGFLCCGVLYAAHLPGLLAEWRSGYGRRVNGVAVGRARARARAGECGRAQMPFTSGSASLKSLFSATVESQIAPLLNYGSGCMNFTGQPPQT